MKILEGLSDVVKPVVSRQVRTENQEIIAALNNNEEITIELAVAVLLVDLAMIDQEFDSREYKYISATFKELYGLQDEDIANLIKQSKNYLAQMRGTSTFASYLKDNVPEEQRVQIGKAISGIIKVDGVEDGFEIYFKNKISALLEVPIE